MSIEAVLFDMDGTLVDSESVHYICWSQLLAPFGVRYEEDDFWMEDDEYSPLRVGEIFSDATFLDFESNKISLSDFEDNFMLITFMFSRCPIPNMCPALIYKQRDIATRFQNNGNLKLLTISFDHLYDTPIILEKKYRILKANNDNWMFLSSYQHLNDLYMLTKQSTFSFWGVEKKWGIASL